MRVVTPVPARVSLLLRKQRTTGSPTHFLVWQRSPRPLPNWLLGSGWIRIVNSGVARPK